MTEAQAPRPLTSEIHKDLLELVAAPTSPELITQLLRVFDKIGLAMRAGEDKSRLNEFLGVVVDVHDQVLSTLNAEADAKRLHTRSVRRSQLRENNAAAERRHIAPHTATHGRHHSFRVDRLTERGY